MAGLKNGIVIDVPAWKVPVISKKKFLKQPEIAVNIKFDTADIKEMPDKQFKAFEVAFEKDFTPTFNKMSNGWFGEMQKKIDETEASLEQLSKDKGNKGDPKKLIDQIVDQANAVLTNRCKVWIQLAQKLAQKAYDDAFAASIKAMKDKVRNAKAKVIVKIVIVVALIATAAVLSVVTMGAGVAISAIVAAAIVGALKTASGTYKEVTKNWDVLATAITAVETEVKDIIKAHAAFQAAELKAAGKWDKVKAFKALLSANVEALDKRVGQLDKFITVTRVSTNKQIKELQDMADQLAKAKADSPEAAKLEVKVLATRQDIAKNLKALDDIVAVQAAAAQAKLAAKEFSPEKLHKSLPGLVKALGPLKAIGSVANKYIGPVKDLLVEMKNIVA